MTHQMAHKTARSHLLNHVWTPFGTCQGAVGSCVAALLRVVGCCGAQAESPRLDSEVCCVARSTWMCPYYTILYYTILYYTILYYTILYYTILYYTTLYNVGMCRMYARECVCLHVLLYMRDRVGRESRLEFPALSAEHCPYDARYCVPGASNGGMWPRSRCRHVEGHLVYYAGSFLSALAQKSLFLLSLTSLTRAPKRERSGKIKRASRGRKRTCP